MLLARLFDHPHRGFGMWRGLGVWQWGRRGSPGDMTISRRATVGAVEWKQ